jgi:NDP-sugar pyrophosphorylase family protein
MRPLTNQTPKALLPVGGRPFLDHLLDDLAAWSALDAVHVAANHRDAGRFRDWADGARTRLPDDVPLSIHDDGAAGPDDALGAVGDLQFLLDRADPDPDTGALVTGGDSLYRFPLAPVLNAAGRLHEGDPSRVLALHEPDPATLRERSVLALNGARVQDLVETPDDPPSTRVCPSWYLLAPDALAATADYLEAGGDRDTLGRLMAFVAHRHRVRAVRLPETPGLRLHCNTPADLRRARNALTDAPRHRLDADAVRRAARDT